MTQIDQTARCWVPIDESFLMQDAIEIRWPMKVIKFPTPRYAEALDWPMKGPLFELGKQVT